MYMPIYISQIKESKFLRNVSYCIHIIDSKNQRTGMLTLTFKLTLIE